MLKEKIRQNLNASLKEKKEMEVLTLRQLLSVVFNREKEKRYGITKERSDLSEGELEKESQLTDEEIIEVISSEIKKRKESIELFGKGGRQDLADKEKKEMRILRKYLPEQLSEEEIKKLAKAAVEKNGAKEMKDMGRVMAELMPHVRGKADGSLVGKIVKELLTPKNE